MSAMMKEKCIKVAKEFETQGNKIRSLAKKQGMMVICNRARLFIDGRPNRRWWFADAKTEILVSEEYGLCDDEALTKLARFREESGAL